MSDENHRYPDFLESRWLSRARALTGADDDETALEKLRPAVQALSDLFTTERPDGGFPDYAADPAKLTAYGLFFFPQSFSKCAAALDQLWRHRGWRPETASRPLRLLDLGSASGPCGIAASLRLARETGRRVTLTALDHSPASLDALARLVRETPELNAFMTVETRIGDLRRAGEVLRELPPQDFVTVGFAANEIFDGPDTAPRLAWLESLRPLLHRNGLLLILEPALRETAGPLRKLRDATLAGPTFHPWGPDIGPTVCPLIANGSKFCDHEVREWTPPASLEYLNRKLHRDIRVLKFAQLPLGLEAAPLPPGPRHAFRITSPFEMNKGGFSFCAVTREGEAVKIDIPNRGLSKSECKQIAARWERGDIAGCEEWTPLGSPGSYRISGYSALIELYSLRIF